MMGWVGGMVFPEAPLNGCRRAQQYEHVMFRFVTVGMMFPPACQLRPSVGLDQGVLVTGEWTEICVLSIHDTTADMSSR